MAAKMIAGKTKTAAKPAKSPKAKTGVAKTKAKPAAAKAKPAKSTKAKTGAAKTTTTRKPAAKKTK